MDAPCPSFQSFALKQGRAVNTGIVEHDNRKGLGRLLLDQTVESLDDHLGGHGRGRCVMDQPALTAQKPRHSKYLPAKPGALFC